MTERYTLNSDGVWISKRTGLPMETPDRGYVPMPRIMRDVRYVSPLSRTEITSRSQRREEMKVHNVREVDPGEYRPTYRKKANAIRNGGEWNPDAGRPEHVDAAPYQRLSRDDLPKHIAKTVAKTS